MISRSSVRGAGRLLTETSASRSFVCRSCRASVQNTNTAISPPQPFFTTTQTRRFTTTPSPQKKAGRSNLSHARTESPPSRQNDPDAPRTPTDEAYDYSDLEAKILKTVEWLAHQLSTLRAGGRLNPETVEKLKVTLKVPASGGNQGRERTETTVRLEEVAQVVPQGRFVKVIASEEGYVKAIMSALLSSQLGMTPSPPTEAEPTTLTLSIPPPTGESRAAAIEQAGKWAEEGLHRIREARGQHQKKLRGYQVAKSVRPDDGQKAMKGMEDVVKRGNEEIKRVLEGAKRVLAGGSGGPKPKEHGFEGRGKA